MSDSIRRIPSVIAPAAPRLAAARRGGRAGVRCVYVLCGGLRHVVPYHFQHIVHAKKRWYGRPLLSVFAAEYAHPDPSYYRRAVQAGLLTINGHAVASDAVVQGGDVVCHTLHRHEPPVSAAPVAVLHSDAAVLVVDKPPSIAIHACGKYMHNTLLGILKHDGYGELYPIHRLDRWTSGLTLLARDARTAAQWSDQLRKQQLSKTYLARVRGEFPEEELTVDAAILCTSQQRGSHKVDPSGKTAITRFRRLSYNGHTSVVQCCPVTGRTHQIRLHLQHVGHPILNDPLYGGHLYEHNSYSVHAQAPPAPAAQPMDPPGEDEPDESTRHLVLSECVDCRTNAYYTGQTHCCSIWLHALSYCGPSFRYETPEPEWAAASFPTAHMQPIRDVVQEVRQARQQQQQQQQVASNTTEPVAQPPV